MFKKTVLILGAGLAGLSAAWHLGRKGVVPLVFEKESTPGGLCRSRKVGEFVFDCDGHVFHFKHRYTFELINNSLKVRLRQHKRNSWVYFNRGYSRYPFQANLFGLPAPVVKECLLGLIEAKSPFQAAGPGKDRDFSSWLKQTFGKGISRYFMEPYNRKFWTVPLKDLNCEWLDGFIPVPSLSDTLDGTIRLSNKQFGYNARFWYPQTGSISSVADAFASGIKQINYNAQAVKIDLANRQVRFHNGSRQKFDYLISTIPLPEMIKLTGARRSDKIVGGLRWNSIFNLNLGLKRQTPTDKHWIYFPGKEADFFRVGFFHNFSPHLAPAGASALYVELAHPPDKPIAKDRTVRRIKRQLYRLGIIQRSGCVCAEDVNRIKYGYPIYDRNYRRSRQEAIDYLFRQGVFACGRYGYWRYFSMEEAILDGKRAADLVVN